MDHSGEQLKEGGGSDGLEEAAGAAAERPEEQLHGEQVWPGKISRSEEVTGKLHLNEESSGASLE